MTSEQKIQGAHTASAILFVHGILSTPEYFRCFIELVPDGWTVCAITLSGHCGIVKDLAKASMAQWKRQVHEALSELRAEHERVFIAAHSMGTLFAIQEASENPVDALFLLNIPLRIHVTPQLLKMCWKLFWDRVDADDIGCLAAKQACSIALDKNIFHYIGWIPRYMELFSEIRRTAGLVEALQVPCFVYLSEDDEMVSPRTEAMLQKTGMKVTMMKNAGHFYYTAKDRAMLLEDFQKNILKR